MSFIEQYLLQLNTEKRRWWLAVVILTALSLVVALVTLWNLRMTGVTLANDASCGYEEHQHTEECLQEDTPICGYEEHIHSISCYSDPKADVETAEIWEATLPKQYYSRWAENLASVARSQIGYRESVKNYVLGNDGSTKQGITRYGQWYGNPYGDWSAMFVAFCLNYANVPQDVIPRSAGVYSMAQLCESEGIVSLPDDDIGTIGNILFLDTDENGSADKVLIVTAATKEHLLAIGGDWENAVAEVTVAVNDPRIEGYIKVDELQPELSFKQPSVMLNASADFVGSFLTTTGKNSWQIVSGGYIGREETNKIGNEDVLVQKNVVPTAIENEFLVYLSIDKKFSWNTVFEYGTYYASSANGTVGEITSLGHGGAELLLDEPSGSSNAGFFMIIQLWNDRKTQLISESDIIMKYTGKTMKNGKIMLQIPGTDQGLVVARVRDYQESTADSPVYIELTESMLSSAGVDVFEKFSVVDTVLDSVVDVMGDHIEFVEVLAGDYTVAPQFENGVLTWYPEPLEISPGDESGETWQRNAAQLVYKIRLKNDKSCLECLNASCSPTGCDHVYPIDSSAVLNYHFSDEPNNARRMAFPTPYVRGLLYDIHFTKVDEDFDFPLKGAVFRLTKAGDHAFVPIEVTSSESGAVSFENLLPGTYTLTEIAAPSGYEITFGGSRNAMEIVLNYTDSPELLISDTYGTSHADKFMYKGAEDGEWRVTNKNTEKLVELPSTGGMGIYVYVLCGLILILGPFVYGFSLRRRYERRSKH